jgi:hypothetical protein
MTFRVLYGGISETEFFLLLESIQTSLLYYLRKDTDGIITLEPVSIGKFGNRVRRSPGIIIGDEKCPDLDVTEGGLFAVVNLAADMAAELGVCDEDLKSA